MTVEAAACSTSVSDQLRCRPNRYSNGDLHTLYVPYTNAAGIKTGAEFMNRRIEMPVNHAHEHRIEWYDAQQNMFVCVFAYHYATGEPHPEQATKELHCCEIVASLHSVAFEFMRNLDASITGMTLQLSHGPFLIPTSATCSCY